MRNIGCIYIHTFRLLVGGGFLDLHLAPLASGTLGMGKGKEGRVILALWSYPYLQERCQLTWGDRCKVGGWPGYGRLLWQEGDE